MMTYPDRSTCSRLPENSIYISFIDQNVPPLHVWNLLQVLLVLHDVYRNYLQIWKWTLLLIGRLKTFKISIPHAWPPLCIPSRTFTLGSKCRAFMIYEVGQSCVLKGLWHGGTRFFVHVVTERQIQSKCSTTHCALAPCVRTCVLGTKMASNSKLSQLSQYAALKCACGFGW